MSDGAYVVFRVLSSDILLGDDAVGFGYFGAVVRITNDFALHLAISEVIFDGVLVVKGFTD